jgi:hypothetical protein
MKITPDFISHKHFHKGKWLKPIQGGSWYYFKPSNRGFSTDLPKNFYKTLDEKFKKIVPYLHNHNIPTTPSCTGHFKGTDVFNNIYDDLTNQKSLIRDNGIVLKDPETEKKYMYHYPNYDLPWDRDFFIEKSSRYQRKGCLGLIINDPNLKNELIGADFITDKVWDEDNKCFLILTNPSNQEELDYIWDDAIELLKIIIS